MYVANTNHGSSDPPPSAPGLRDVLARREPSTADEAAVGTATLLAVLETLPSAAFVVTASGEVVHANTRGRREVEEGALDLRRCLEAPRGSEHVIVHPLPKGSDGGGRVLVLRSDPVAAAAARIARAAEEWQLTRHQIAVLGLLVHGEANKTIAERRKCSLRTVEVHVSGLLKKSGTACRAELIARFWTLR